MEVLERSWFEHCLPTIVQHGESCVGQAWANWMECMIRRHIGRAAIPAGCQIDGHAIWRKAREMFWRGDLTGGIYPDQGFLAAVELGILPPYSELAMVLDVPGCVSAGLMETPLVQSHLVHQGWLNASAENGCIEHYEHPRREDALGGHATLRIGLLLRDNQVFYPLLNSWGSAWGWNGIGILSAAQSSTTRMESMCYTCRLPANWQQWTGWRKFLTKEAQ